MGSLSNFKIGLKKGFLAQVKQVLRVDGFG
jgi:hypothetical protein